MNYSGNSWGFLNGRAAKKVEEERKNALEVDSKAQEALETQDEEANRRTLVLQSSVRAYRARERMRVILSNTFSDSLQAEA